MTGLPRWRSSGSTNNSSVARLVSVFSCTREGKLRRLLHVDDTPVQSDLILPSGVSRWASTADLGKVLPLPVTCT